MPERHVVVVAFPRLQPLDAIGPIEVFSGATQAARAQGSGEGYRITFGSIDGQPVWSNSGVGLCTSPLPDIDGPIDTLVLPGGDGTASALHNEALLAWVRIVAPNCRRVATVCSGAFLGAEAGLLNGRRVTTHWARADQLRTEYPALNVDPDPIYIRDGKYWSSAGVTAGIDLSLALVEDDLGVAVSQTVARWLVMFLHRPGGQTQFATPVWVPRAERSTVRAVQTLVESAPAGDHRLPVLAAAAAMSLRHFARVFSAEVGETPGRFVERVRLGVARQALETTDDTLDRIAMLSGLGSAETLRRVFHKHLNVSPDAYRQRFRTTRQEGFTA
jgi:transcriptional regulator GlxA family with amidase domain